MNYDDTVERLAKAVASQIDSVEKYEEVINKLDSVKSNNMYAHTMEYFVRQYTDKSIIMEYDNRSEDDIDATLEMARNKRKRIPVKLNIVNIFKRRAI